MHGKVKTNSKFIGGTLMTDKQKRHQEVEREVITDDVKARIQAKSDDKCVWCGKKVFLGYKGTIDHFVPLKKGGTNEEVNLVLMCSDCNQKKGSRIFPINVAATHLKEQYYDELGNYFEAFTKKYKYISRGNLMASDVYEMVYIPTPLENVQYKFNKKHKNINLKSRGGRSLLKRAYPDDQDRIVEYYTKYLKKYDLLDSPEAARENIKFWFRFGCIYYIERNNEIYLIACVTVNNNGYINFDMFTYYSTDMAWALTDSTITCLSNAIMRENDLMYLPICANIVEIDELSRNTIVGRVASARDGWMFCQFAFKLSPKCYKLTEEQRQEDNKRFAKFLYNFKDIEDEIMIYLYENDLLDYSWMAQEITDRDFYANDVLAKFKIALDQF